MANRLMIAVVLYPVINAVVFGCLAIAVLSIPALAISAKIFLPAAIETSLIIAVPLSWQIAPELRAHRIRHR